MIKQIDQYLNAMKADSIPAGWSGVWFVEKVHVPGYIACHRHGKPIILNSGDYTYLRRLTDSTLYTTQPGEVVMEDTPFELKTHLGFATRAYGNVLVTGLGLGCVVRGLLVNQRVQHITVLENSPDVLKLVAPHMPTDRLTIIEADALKWTAQNKQAFDCAWHDLWTNMEEGEPHLDVWHSELFFNLRGTTKHQGAWAFDRTMRRLVQKGISWIG